VTEKENASYPVTDELTIEQSDFSVRKLKFGRYEGKAHHISLYGTKYSFIFRAWGKNRAEKICQDWINSYEAKSSA